MDFKTPQVRRDYFKKYYRANKAKYAELSKQWWKNHPEKLRAKWRRKYANNKEVHKIRCRERRLKNVDHCRAVNRDWQKRNWIHRQQYIKDYYAKNANKIKERTKRRYRLNKADSINRNKLWKKNNPEKCRAIYRRYANSHPAQILQHASKRRALKRKATIGNTKLILRWMQDIKRKDFSTCYYCQSEVSTSDIHFDHVRALNDGGAHCVENLCVSCPKCNFSKNDTPIHSWYKLGQQVLAL